MLGELKHGQDWRQEIVAELCAAVLCKMVGKTSKHLGNHFRYIESYAKSANLTPWQGCMRVISDTEKVLNLIMGWNSRNELEEPKIDRTLLVEGNSIQIYGAS